MKVNLKCECAVWEIPQEHVCRVMASNTLCTGCGARPRANRRQIVEALADPTDPFASKETGLSFNEILELLEEDLYDDVQDLN